MNRTFHLRRSIQLLGIVLTLAFSTAFVVYLCILLLPEPQQHGFKTDDSAVVVGGLGALLFAGMTLLSLYMLMAYYVEQLSICGRTVRVKSVFQNYQFDISELRKLNWKATPRSGRLVFQLGTKAAKLDLNGFCNEDRLSIIRLLHALIPPEKQDGWPLFCQQVAIPLRDGWCEGRYPEAATILITRQRYDRLMAVALPGSVVIPAVVWLAIGWTPLFVLPVLTTMSWLLLRYSIPPEGCRSVRVTHTPGGRAHLAVWILVVASQLIMIACIFVGVERNTACGVGAVIVGAAFVPLIYHLYRADKQRHCDDALAAESAPGIWEKGEKTTAAT